MAEPGGPVELEAAVATLLRAGVVVAGSLIAAGIVWLLAAGDPAFPAGSRDLLATLGRPPTALPVRPGEMFAELARGMAGVAPSAMITLGLLVLVLTPVLRVAATAALFARRGDRAFAAIAIVVLSLLLISIGGGLHR